MKLGHFVIDLSVVDAPKIKEVIEIFNVTCPRMINITSPYTVPYI